MIKPINITPLNTCNTLEYKCENCGNFGNIHLDKGINVGNDGNFDYPLDSYDCPKCQEKL